jgi:hypothetical protein
MRYLWSVLALILLLLFCAPPVSAARKRTSGQESSLKHVRKPQKPNLRPLVYDAKKNRPLVVKQKRRGRR